MYLLLLAAAMTRLACVLVLCLSLQPGYLGSQGLAARGLLTTTADAGGASPRALQLTGQDNDSTAAHDNDSSGSVLEGVSAWAADQVEGLGFAVVRLGRWMRSKLSGGEQEAKAEGGSAAAAGGSDPAFMRRVGGGTLAAVMVAMVAIISIVLLKKPLTLRRLSQVMRAK